MDPNDIFAGFVIQIHGLVVINGIINSRRTHIEAQHRQGEEAGINPIEAPQAIIGPEEARQHGKAAGHLGPELNKFKENRQFLLNLQQDDTPHSLVGSYP